MKRTDMAMQITHKANGYLIERPDLDHHPWILGVQGSPYEMGYQQGILLGEKIRQTASGFLSPIFAQFGGWRPESGVAPTLDQMQTGRGVLADVYQSYFEPALKKQAPDLLSEMNGIAAGVQKACGDIPREDILIGNCIPEITETLFYLPPGDADNLAGAKGCSDCIIFGRATQKGHLIHGTNYDYATFNILHKGIGIVVAKPESGHPFLAQCLAGTVGFYRGMNDQGITVGEPTSDSADRNIKTHMRIPHAMHMRKLIQFTTCLDDAVRLMQNLKGTTGYNHSIGDAKVPSAIDIETSCTQFGLVRPRPDMDAICNANHFAAYPGFNGYSGQNLAKDQLKYWGIDWRLADTVPKWQAAVRKETDKRTFSWQRYETMVNMVKKAYGHLDVDAMIQILSTWPLARKPQLLGQLSPICEQLYGLKGPISDMKLASIFSTVFDPANETAWVAVGAEPAQSGTYWPVHLPSYLAALEDQSALPAIDAIQGKPGSPLKNRIAS